MAKADAGEGGTAKEAPPSTTAYAADASSDGADAQESRENRAVRPGNQRAALPGFPQADTKQSALARLKRGDSTPRRAAFAKLAAALELSVTQLEE